MHHAFVVAGTRRGRNEFRNLPLYPPDEVSGQLILSNLSLASSGTYRCVATNQMGSAACELSFSVTGRDVGHGPGCQAWMAQAAWSCLRRGPGGSAALRTLCILRPFPGPRGWGSDRGAPGRAVPVHCCVLPNTIPEREEEEASGDIQGQ